MGSFCSSLGSGRVTVTLCDWLTLDGQLMNVDSQLPCPLTVFIPTVTVGITLKHDTL